MFKIITLLLKTNRESIDEWFRVLLSREKELLKNPSRDNLVKFLEHFAFAREVELSWERDIKWMAVNQLSGAAYKNSIMLTIMKFASIFGVVSNGHDSFVFNYLVSKLFPAILTSGEKIQTKIAENLSNYPAYPGTGEHRFFPIIEVLNNIFNERDIFEPVSDDIGSDYVSYLREEAPLAIGKKEGVSFHRPNIKIELPIEIDVPISILDVGSAPKTGGSLPLLAISKYLQRDSRIYGIDVQPPMFCFSDGVISYSDYYDPIQGEMRKKAVVEGITYLNAHPNVDKVGRYSVLGKNFDPVGGQRFDIITFSMVYQHFHEGNEAKEKLPITSHNLVDENNMDFRYRSKAMIYPGQQRALDNLLSKLKIGGICFANFSMISFDFDDLFFMIQRIDEDKFKIYADHPVVFRISRDNIQEFWPASIFVESSEEGNENSWYIFLSRKLKGKNISQYIDLNREEKDDLKKLFERAANLASHYQGWQRGIWGKLSLVGQAIMEDFLLVNIFEIYLQDVPDYIEEKQAILEEVAEIRAS